MIEVMGGRPGRLRISPRPRWIFGRDCFACRNDAAPSPASEEGQQTRTYTGSSCLPALRRDQR